MLWIKALHVAFTVTWFAGLFYLPRVFVYHAMTPAEAAAQRETFKVMERKLLGITSLGALLTLLFGALLLVLQPWLLQMRWLQLKLLLLLGLFGYHLWCARIVREFREERNTHDHVWFRWFNEVPVAFLFGIVILAVVKPFGA